MLKDEVLRLLDDKFISGQEICTRLGVSRTAVWKAVSALKRDGYQIEASTNKGYKLVKDIEKLGKAEIDEQLLKNGVEIYSVFEKSLDSTNIKARELAINGVLELHHNRILVAADEQVSGRGRRGRKWLSPAGTGIWMSLCIKPDLEPRYASMITLAGAISAAKAIEEISGLNVGIKWPNDIVIGVKKVCGILTEMSADMDEIHYVICGIGINVNTDEFENEISHTATSIYIEGKKKIDRAELIALVTKYFFVYLEYLERDMSLKAVKAEYEKYLVNIGKEVRILSEGKECTAIARGIDEDGALIVEKNGNLESIISGEVSVRGMYGYV